jgi:carbon-monoxide dehydrogenase medium subunit
VKAAPFEYVAPQTLSGAIDALSAAGDDAKVIAGGQSLVPALAFRIVRPSVLIDLNRVPGLDEIRVSGDTLSIGAMARQREVEQLPGLRERCTMLTEAIALVGHPAIRNRGTVGGSLAHADPAAEWGALALALDAELDVAGPDGTRTVAARDLVVTYFTTTLARDEVLTQIRLRLPPPGSGSCFVELARRHGDFALAGVAALVVLAEDGTVGHARLALIGVGDRPIRSTAAEAVLIGEPPTADSIAAAASAVRSEIAPTDDIHATADYRSHLGEVLTRRALTTAAGRASRGAA